MRTLVPVVLSLLCACSTSGRSAAPGTSLGDDLASAPTSDALPNDGGADAAAEAGDGGDGTGAEPFDYDAQVDALLADLGVPGQANPRSSLGLRLAVAEGGPEKPWLLAVINDGDEPVRLSADPRLLRLRVEVPGKKKPVTCQLPENLFPKKSDRRLDVILGPGEGVAHAFDPRLYCFTSMGQKELVPGAIITPLLGWAPKMRVSWKGGKRVESLADQSPPYVAELVPLPPPEEPGAKPPAPAEAKKSSAESKTEDENDDDDALKQLEGNTFALRSTYSEWVSKAAEHSQKNPDTPLAIHMVQGSDAQAERTATVSISVKNRGKSAQKVYFRRELVSFEVMGPDGLTSCDPQPDSRAPDPQAYSTLRAGGSLTVASRLVELCPEGTFARPGLYLVHARFDARETGDEYGVDAFTGTMASPEPVAVRIRTGELPFLQKRTMRKIVVEDEPGDQKPKGK